MSTTINSFSWMQRKLLIKRALLVMILALFAGLVVPMTVGAANGNYIEDIIGDEKQDKVITVNLEDAVTKNINDFATIVYGQHSWNKNADDSKKAMMSDNVGFSEMLRRSEWIDNIWGVLVGIGGAMVTFYAFVEVMRELEKGTCDFDMWLRMFTKITIGVFVIANVPQLASWMDQLGTVISQALSGALKSAARDIASNLSEADTQALAGGIFGMLSKILAKATSNKFFNSMYNGFFGLCAWGLDTGFQIAMKAYAYALMIDLFVRKAFMPIACARVCGEGWQSSGMRNLKKYMAVNLRAAIIMTIYAAGEALLVTHSGWIKASLLRQLIPHFIVRGAIQSATLGLAAQAQSFADEIIGVDR